MLNSASCLRLCSVVLLLLFCQWIIAMSFLTDDRIHSALLDNGFLCLIASIKIQVLPLVTFFNQGLYDI